MSEKDPILYECTDCPSEFEISWKSHADSRYYAECDCGEMALPAYKSDYSTMNADSAEVKAFKKQLEKSPLIRAPTL